MNRLTNIFKLFSDETRLRMLVLLCQENLCVCELSGILDIPQPRILQNPGKLRDMDLVIDFLIAKCRTTLNSIPTPWQ